MKLKSLMYKAIGALLALPLVPSLAMAFQMQRTNRVEFEGMTPHAHWDALWDETMWDITIIGIIYFAIAVYFMVRYKRTGHGQVGESPKLSPQAKIGWVVIPCFLFLGDDLFLFAKNFDLHNHYRQVPVNAAEVKVTGSMWNWNYEYPTGVDADGELRVVVGKPVVLRMTSDDVVHSHYLNQFRVTEDVMPGRVTWQWFLPDKLGESVVTCREYCGTNHSKMYGKVIVMTQSDYDAWMQEQLAAAEPSAPHQVAKIEQPRAVKAGQI